MKCMYSFVLFFLLLGFTSCQKEEAIDEAIAPEALIGNWETHEIIVNGDPNSETSTWLTNNKYWSMSIQEENQFYYRNYISGTWSVEGRQLVFTNEWSPSQRFTILDISETSLTLQIQLTEGEYCCGFDEFESDEVLTIVEYFVRN